MYTKFIIIVLSLIFPVKVFAYSFDQKTSNKKSEIFYDFSVMPYDYVVPHKYNTTLKAAKIEKDTLKITLEPGMRGSSGDVKYQRTERAEIGFKMPINGTLYYSFKMKTPEGFKTVNEQFDEIRTMIAQIKAPPATLTLSPPISVYLSDYGRVACMEYKEGSSKDSWGRVNKVKQIGHYAKIYDLLKIELADGEWHKIEMTLKISKKNGSCKVVIDGQSIIEKNNLSNAPGKIKYLIPRIGIYRDNLSYSQTVYFDDLTIKFTPE